MSEPVKLNEVEELWVSSNYSMRPPSSADLIAAVRRGVESGTIKGEVDVDWRLIDLKLPHGDYIVIGPVSDGGSET